MIRSKSTRDDNGNPIQVTIDDKGNPTPVTIADKSNPIPVTIDDKSDPILTAYTAPTTAEICSGKDVQDLWESPCDNDLASIQRLHEFCLNLPFGVECYEDDDARHEFCLNNPFDYYSGCYEDDNYDNARLESCADNFNATCAYADGLEFYALRIKFCNNPANAGHEACSVSSEPTVSSDPTVNHSGYLQNEFLQGHGGWFEYGQSAYL